MASPTKLAGKQLRHLRALAHGLKPIVQIGKHGFTDAAVAQVDRALLDHELIKIRVMPECPDELANVATQAREKLSAHVAQTIGAIVVLYRAHPKEPKIQLPKAKS
jgi:RNA-binding protein